MNSISREQLHAYIDDALSETEMARIEQALRDSDQLKAALQSAREERDRGEHSVGAIWRRDRLSCPSREELNRFLLDCVEPEMKAYLEFHLHTILCPTCLANLDDLRDKLSPQAVRASRRRKIFDSSAGLLGNTKTQSRTDQ